MTVPELNKYVIEEINNFILIKKEWLLVGCSGSLVITLLPFRGSRSQWNEIQICRRYLRRELVASHNIACSFTTQMRRDRKATRVAPDDTDLPHRCDRDGDGLIYWPNAMGLAASLTLDILGACFTSRLISTLYLSFAWTYFHSKILLVLLVTYCCVITTILYTVYKCLICDRGLQNATRRPKQELQIINI